MLGNAATNGWDGPISASMRWLRTSSRGLIAVALVSAAGSFLLGAGTSAAAARRSVTASASAASRATALLNKAFADATSRGSFHQTVTQDFGNQSGTLANDVALKSGRQLITSTDGTRAQVEVVGRTAYVAGNQYALKSYFNFNNAEVASIGGAWVGIPSNETAFASIAYDVTVSTALSAVAPTGALTEGPKTTLDGQSVVAITGGIPAIYSGTGKTTLYVTASSDPLPVRSTIQVTRPPYPTISVTGTMGNWGEHVSVTPPTSTLTFKELSARARQLAPLAIAGTAGYFTFTGPHALPAPVGRPWGTACKPVALVVGNALPAAVKTQVLQVVAAAGKQGLDVVATSSARALPGGLYYRLGQSAKTAARVSIASSTGTPPKQADGQPALISIGWKMRADGDKHNDDLTQVTGTLEMTALAGHPDLVRQAIRQLIAWTQGVGPTGNAVSGISPISMTDRFTPADITAMMKMSGCAKPSTTGIAA